MPVIEVEHLRKTYGSVVAVDDVSFQNLGKGIPMGVSFANNREGEAPVEPLFATVREQICHFERLGELR